MVRLKRMYVLHVHTAKNQGQWTQSFTCLYLNISLCKKLCFVHKTASSSQVQKYKVGILRPACSIFCHVMQKHLERTSYRFFFVLQK